MAVLTRGQLFAKVKDAMGITNTYNDNQLTPYFDDVMDVVEKAGVKNETLLNDACVGVVTRGVIDLWNYGSGEAKLSEYFYQRVAQLALNEEEDEDDEN